jgi:hypothetical protein
MVDACSPKIPRSHPKPVELDFFTANHDRLTEPHELVAWCFEMLLKLQLTHGTFV